MKILHFVKRTTKNENEMTPVKTYVSYTVCNTCVDIIVARGLSKH